MRDDETIQHPSSPLAPASAVVNVQHLKVLKSMREKTLQNMSFTDIETIILKLVLIVQEFNHVHNTENKSFNSSFK
jgi:hypothetical protein